jgi:hypothetical protein
LPEPGPATDVLAEHQAPPLTPVSDAVPKRVSVLDRDVFKELVREIGGETASEIHLVFIAETEARLKLLRELAIDRERTRLGRCHGRGLFVRRRGAGVAQLMPARRACTAVLLRFRFFIYE